MIKNYNRITQKKGGGTEQHNLQKKEKEKEKKMFFPLQLICFQKQSSFKF